MSAEAAQKVNSGSFLQWDGVMSPSYNRLGVIIQETENGPGTLCNCFIKSSLPPFLHAPYVTHLLCRQVTIPAATVVGWNEDGGGKRKEGKVSGE